MPVIVEDIAEAIQDALNDGANDAHFPEEFTAQVVYVNENAYEDLTTDPRVLIFPRLEMNEREDRGENQFTLGVGIAVIRKVTAQDVDTIKPLLALPRALRDFLIFRDYANAAWKNTSIEALYGHDELKDDATLVSTLGSDYWIYQ